MSILDIFQQKNSPGGSAVPPRKALLAIAATIPNQCKSHQHFTEYREYMEHNEWGLALESLLELAGETPHTFPTTFWSQMAACATSMDMHGEADYCLRQIGQNGD